MFLRRRVNGSEITSVSFSFAAIMTNMIWRLHGGSDSLSLNLIVYAMIMLDLICVGVICGCNTDYMGKTIYRVKRPYDRLPKDICSVFLGEFVLFVIFVISFKYIIFPIGFVKIFIVSKLDKSINLLDRE